MDQVQLRPYSVGRALGSNTSVTLAGGGYLAGVMYRARAATVINPGMVVSPVFDDEDAAGRPIRKRINPWVIDESGPIVDLEFSIMPAVAGFSIPFGVAVESASVGREVLIAGVGSIVTAQCVSAAANPALQTVGQHVKVDNTFAGMVEPSSAVITDLGTIVGRIVIPAGNSALHGNHTNSDVYVGIYVQPF